MKRLAIGLIFSLLLVSGCSKPVSHEPLVVQNQFSVLPVWDPQYTTARAIEVDGGPPEANELDDIQCPIPMDCRVRNRTGIQCVYASIECLARWADCKALLEPKPLTSRPGCQGFSNPSQAAARLQQYGVRFEQEYSNREAALQLIRKAMEEGRGCLFGIPGHAMVLCHYDEEKGVVKYINNSDSSLRINEWTMNEFNRRWQGWVLVIYAEPDVIPQKMRKGPNAIPIIDRNSPQGEYPKNYIPVPEK